ncbi:hypothetical protein RHMOL_Rhmol04G0362500 [Rhododendron molle]|uniref:Uncharacterized protein n=1 Tax=Rhododendron molle TaxID=49168 RepID=A0ACC0PAG3_RHOML|nr:hypothetical protein RHMOL_Rhmol04G0362500 [Rhododendron molle]
MSRQADLVEIGKDGFAILDESYGRNKKKPPPHLVEIGKDGFAILEESYGRNKKKPPPHQEVQHRPPTPSLRPVVQPIQDPFIWRYRGAKSYEAVVITEAKHHNFVAYGRHFAQMARQADYDHLVKVGLEGFAMVDKLFGPERYQKQQQKYQQKQKPQMKQEVAIDCNEAAKLYGGMVVADFKRKPLRAAY